MMDRISTLPDNRIKFYAIVVIALLAGCATLVQSTSTAQPQHKKLRFEDCRYEANIASDILYPNRGFEQDVIQPSIIALNGGAPLILEFDDLHADYQDYNAKLIHCNANWTRSSVPELEFSDTYNQYPIRIYDFAQSTITPYTHYTFEVPPVRLAGNYLLIVYRGNDEKDLILSRRIVVFDSRVQVKPKIAVRTGTGGRFQHHQIELEINYGGLKLPNPYTDISVAIRQNQRWDNAITNLKPTQVRQDRSMLYYRHFTGENVFPSLNEFRIADLRATTFRGQNISRIEKTNENLAIHLKIDQPRANQIYSQYSDLNGGYVIENNDPGVDYLQEDYFSANFYLDQPPMDKNIYVLGAFNHWQKTDKMVFNTDSRMYTAQIQLKQGFYSYLYWVEGGTPNPYQLEGCFFEAENDYDVLVYARDRSKFADIAVGYVSFNSRN